MRARSTHRGSVPTEVTDEAVHTTDELLHAIRAQVVAALRLKRRKYKLPWAKCVTSLRTNSAYSARMRGISDASWITYAKGMRT